MGCSSTLNHGFECRDRGVAINYVELRQKDNGEEGSGKGEVVRAMRG